MGFSTDAIHVGQEPDALTGAIVAPIYQTSTYVIEAMGKSKGYDYARTAHPNRRLSSAPSQSSKAATPPTFSLPEWRRSIQCSACCVRATTPYFRKRFMAASSASPRSSWSSSAWNSVMWIPRSLEKVRRRSSPARRMIYVETPTNPTMIVTDIAAIAKLAHEQESDRRGGQHIPKPLSPAAARAGRGHRGPLHDQVLKRPQRLHRRRGNRQHAGAGRENLFRAALRRRRPRSHGLLSGFARREDARGAHGPPQFQRHGAWPSIWTAIPR